MSDIAVRVKNLGKMYLIGGPQEKYATLRDTISSTASAPFRKVRSLMRGESASGLSEKIWALKDVSFEVKHGEVVGIIGRNGAGKSTLLKILSRITEPTTGHADIYGRVGALLEVGTGFHPELTGRENVYLNGAILGMSRHDIDRKFDEIVDFAGVEKFIDTPVKHYSSGMGLRLGFAVAAHLEPEILIVDEVLAVGDAEFQKKCLGKMSDVASDGRTVIFVSHNMPSIQALCSQGVLLTQGAVEFLGAIEDCISRYLGDKYAGSADVDLRLHASRQKSCSAQLLRLRLLDSSGTEKYQFEIGETIVMELDVESTSLVNQPQIGIGVNTDLGQRVFTVSTRFLDVQFGRFTGRGRFRCHISNVNLAPGIYRLKLTFGSSMHDTDVLDNVPGFEIIPSDIFGTGKIPSASQGIIYVHPTWYFSSESNL